MNLALWKKAVADAWRQALISALLLVLFAWLFVWLMSFFQVGAWGAMLNLLPNFVQPMLGVPIARLATPAGQLSVLYVHVITILVCVGWAVGRGSDSIAGEIGRGTMDLLLSLPVWRITVMAIPAAVAAIGAGILAFAVWCGTWLGLHSVNLAPNAGGNPAASQFLPGVINLWAMTFCFTGITTLVSSWSRDRWRTILPAGGFFVAELILKMTARIWPTATWLKYITFLSAFEPQRLILVPEDAVLAARYNGTLLALGLAAYVAAGVIFARRDIPAMS